MSAADPAFRETRTPRVHAYVDRVCLPELVDEASAAAFVDFVARAASDAGEGTDPELDLLLLDATRSAAASRFAVAVPMGHPGLALTSACRAMPELLAVQANRPSPGDEQLIADHLVDCAVCAHTLTRMQSAEQAFAAAAGSLSALEIQETRVDTSKARLRPHPARVGPGRPGSPRATRGPKPVPQPETFSHSARSAGAAQPDPPSPRRRRSGGLVGAIRRFGRPPGA